MDLDKLVLLYPNNDSSEWRRFLQDHDRLHYSIKSMSYAEDKELCMKHASKGYKKAKKFKQEFLAWRLMQ